MQRHVLDTPGDAPKSGLDRAVKIEMDQHPSRLTLALQRRARKRDDSKKVQEFLRVEREEGV